MKDGMEHWRWCDRLSVIEAAMLAAEIDPAVFVLIGNPLESECCFREIENTANHIRSPTFVAVFQSLRRAILAGDLPVAFKYSMRQIPSASWFSPDESDRMREGEQRLPEVLIVSSKQLLAPGKHIDPDDEILFQEEPDWQETTVATDNLRAWMESKGRTPAFFFPPKDTVAQDDFMDPNHDHFAPELALAVKAWRALASVQKTPGGVRATIEKWIEANPNEWGPLDCSGTDPKARIATVANWNKGGGASRTGG